MEQSAERMRLKETIPSTCTPCGRPGSILEAATWCGGVKSEELHSAGMCFPRGAAGTSRAPGVPPSLKGEKHPL